MKKQQQQQQQQQQQAAKPRKEKPLDTFVPTTYMALLEGTLLPSGDLKGSWRMRREDTAQHDFCMALEGRGLYRGGFNIRVPQANSSAPSILEIHDKWHSVEWVDTTQTSCNVWGRGQNKEFGEFYTIGVHVPRQGRVVIYKVCEEEMRRAQAFARADQAAVTPFAADLDPAAAAVTVAAVPPTAAAATTAPAPAAVPAVARRAAAAAAAPPAMVTRAATGGGRRKRPRVCANSTSGDVVQAATMLIQTSGGGGGRSSSRGSGCCPHAGARSPESDGSAGGGGGSGGIDPMSVADEGSGGGPALGGGRTISRPVAKRSADAPLPASVPIPTEAVQMRSMSHHGYASASSCLPGFSGRFDDASAAGSGGTRVADASVDELADLSILGARLQKEKLRIHEAARARRRALEEEQGRLQRKVHKSKADEALMLRAVQELRKKMVEDQRQLHSAAQRVQTVEEEERQALVVWNHKWATQVAPFIAQCEQGVKKKAEELEKKTREAQQEREELEREQQRLHSVKQIADVVFPTHLGI